MSFITEMDKISDMKIENGEDLRNVMQPTRRRSLPTFSIPKLNDGSKTFRLKVI